MKVYLEKEDREVEIKVTGEVPLNEILKEMDVSLSSVIIVKNGFVCLEDELVSSKDEIKLLSVVSGG